MQRDAAVEHLAKAFCSEDGRIWHLMTDAARDRYLALGGRYHDKLLAKAKELIVDPSRLTREQIEQALAEFCDEENERDQASAPDDGESKEGIASGVPGGDET